MTPQELKNSILQLAVQGKLVEQRAEEGTAEELFVRIQEEKQRLIAEKKIKKEKPLPEIAEDEKPFDIPENWKWVRIGEIFGLQAGKNIISANIYEEESKENPYRCYGGNGVRGFVATYNREGHFALIGRQGALCGNINLAKEKFYATEHAVVVEQYNMTDVLWCGWFLKALNLNQYATATAQPGLAVANIVKVLIPLPPLAEQRRIVSKIKELLPYIDRYEQAWSKLEQFNSRFPEDMKKSLLQYAIQGKLVEQRPEEGTAEELFDQIQQEKQRLIAEKKIKKEKPLPKITEDEKPFDIPESWKWVRLQQIGELGRGRSQKRPRNDPNLFINGTFPFIQTGDVARANGHISCWSTMYNQEGIAQSRIWPSGTVCLTIAANIGDVAILDFDSCFPDSVVGFNAYKPIMSNEFFMYGLMCYKTILDKLSRSTAQKNINIEILSQIAFPLPPLAEQKRIVEKLEQLLPLCERLK